MPTPADQVALSPSQAGRYLNRSAKAVRTLLDRGVLKGTRIGSGGHRRVTLEQLQQYEAARADLMRRLGVKARG